MMYPFFLSILITLSGEILWNRLVGYGEVAVVIHAAFARDYAKWQWFMRQECENKLNLFP
jgi:general stress protein CsbA